MRLPSIDNPYTNFVGAFVFAFVLYTPFLSSMFPPLGGEVYVLLCGAIIVAMAIGILMQRKVDLVRSTGAVALAGQTRSRAFGFAALVLPLAIIEITLYPNIPLLQALKGGTGGPKNFIVEYGIPSVHAMIVILCQIAIVQGVNEVSLGRTRRWRSVASAAIGFVLLVLFMNRGAILICAMAALYGNIARLRRVSARKLFTSAMAIMFTLFLFGRVGDLRSGGGDYILTTGGANTRIFGGLVPSEAFWGYIYFTSPLANLQRTVESHPSRNAIDLNTVILLDVVPDVVSKRISRLSSVWEDQRPLVNDAFTVGTMFSRPYYFGGIGGALLIFIWWVLVSQLSLSLAAKSGVFATTMLGFVDVMGFFCVFTNTAVFSSIVGPIAVCAILAIAKRLNKGGMA